MFARVLSAERLIRSLAESQTYKPDAPKMRAHGANRPEPPPPPKEPSAPLLNPTDIRYSSRGAISQDPQYGSNDFRY